MFGMTNKKVSTESYKGVRDFYPEDQAVQNYIFGVMRKVAESWGYLEYGASVLEPLELYKSKSSEEIVNDQIYSFTDRGDREVALRPEMTPTVARMVAARIQELPKPVRWYSIPNLFRYEKPQRGRLREHWQLNVDIFGISSPYADAEIIMVAADIMKKFGAKNEDFVIKINSRELLQAMLKKASIPESDSLLVYRLIDKKEKMPEDEFRRSMASLVGEEPAEKILEMLYFDGALTTVFREEASASRLEEVINILKSGGVSNVVFEPTLTRGFDYYTGVVFEVFDTNKENPRSLFGGGRYDNLAENFVNEKIPAFGFGMGDVTIHDFLETHELLPDLASSTDLYIAVAPEADLAEVYKVADAFREKGVNVAVDIGNKKLADQLKSLEKNKVPFVVTIGPTEIETKQFTLRNTKTREEKTGSIEEVSRLLMDVEPTRFR